MTGRPQGFEGKPRLYFCKYLNFNIHFPKEFLSRTLSKNSLELELEMSVSNRGLNLAVQPLPAFERVASEAGKLTTFGLQVLGRYSSAGSRNEGET